MSARVDWSRVRHFAKREWRTDPNKVDPQLVYLVEQFRVYVNRPVRIHVAYETKGHTEGSDHYTGKAVDLHVEGLDLLNQWIAAERFPFMGIGLYPFWKDQGLHLDVGKPVKSFLLDGGRRWWRDKNGVYQPLDRRFIASLLNHDGYGVG